MRSEARVIVTNPTGLHARPAVKLAQLAAGFDAHIEIRAGSDGEWVRARSTARVMKLKAGAHTTIHLRAEGNEADDALSALVDFVRRDFDEGPAAALPDETAQRRDEAARDDSNVFGAAPDDAPANDEAPAAATPPSELIGRHGETPCDDPDISDAAPDNAPGNDQGPAAATGDRAGEGLASSAARPSPERATPATAATESARNGAEPAPWEAPKPSVAAPQAPHERAVTGEGMSKGGREIPAVVASPGLAIGILHLPAPIGPANSDLTARRPGDADLERVAFDAAVARTIDRLRALAGSAGGLGRDVIGFQISLLEDEEFIGPIQGVIDAGSAADRAWLDHLAGEIADCESAPTAYLRERAADLRDLRERVAMALADDADAGPDVGACTDAGPDPDVWPGPYVVIADELTPSRFLELDRSRVVAVATRSGSVAGHAAMLARAHGLPMLVQLACDASELKPGTEAIVDAEKGRLVLAPPHAVRERYSLRIEARRTRAREAAKHASRPARTRAGVRVQVLVNVGDPAELAAVDPSHCDGIGLARTEFLFHGTDGLPGERTQIERYRRLVAWAGGRPVTVRTLDAGGDKPVPGLTIEGESNPFLGLRGVRLSLSRPEVLATQLRALARVAAGAEVKVMLPMVTNPEEIDQVRRLLESEVRALRAAGIEAAAPRLGMMVEVPAAALTVERFDADFFSIGTNDLAQYVLAAGRDSAAVADLLDPLHPAVVELISRVADAGARTGREVSVCGEMAARPECLHALLEAGVRVLSVPPAALASTKAALAAL